jgi:hypothetical protein
MTEMNNESNQLDQIENYKSHCQERFNRKERFHQGSTKRLYKSNESINKSRDRDEIIRLEDEMIQVQNQMITVRNEMMCVRNEIAKRFIQKNTDFEKGLKHKCGYKYKDYEESSAMMDCIVDTIEKRRDTIEKRRDTTVQTTEKPNFEIKQSVKLEKDNRNRNWKNNEFNFIVSLPVVEEITMKRIETEHINIDYPKSKDSFLSFFSNWRFEGVKNSGVLTKDLFKSKKGWETKKEEFDCSKIRYVWNATEGNSLKYVGFTIKKGNEFCTKMDYGFSKRSCEKYAESDLKYETRVKREHKGIDKGKKISIIDLGKNKRIDYFGLMGKKYCRVGRYVNGGRLLELYVAENDSIWMTKFRLFYRMDGGKEWIGLGEFSGNENRFTEKLYDLNLEFRYLKIECISFNGNYLNYQFGLYVKKPETNKEYNEKYVKYQVRMMKEIDYVNKWRAYDKWDKLSRNRNYKKFGSGIRRNIEKNIKMDFNEYTVKPRVSDEYAVKPRVSDEYAVKLRVSDEYSS